MFGEDRGAPEAANRLGLTDRLDEALLRLEHWRYRRVLITACAGLALVALGAGWAYGRTTAKPEVETRIPQASMVAATATSVTAEDPPPTIDGGRDTADASDLQQPTELDAEQPVVGQYVVHVVGEVNRPGLVVVAIDARVNDVVMAAGGPTVDADLQRLNLASPVVDGMQVRVPAAGAEDVGPLLTQPAGGTPGAATGEPGPVNLNTASQDLLETLPGVGPATAAAIVSWREENGGFRTPEELMDVPGIGPVKLAAVRDLITT